MRTSAKAVLTIASLLLLPTLSVAEVCQYGLFAQTAQDCKATEGIALQRVASAKTICYSANSEIQWSKNNKEPVGVFPIMRSAARSAMTGFVPVYSCERADLVVKIDYDGISPEQVTLAITDAESGDVVFHEQRFVSDLSSDLTRMATHFQNMRSDAVTIRNATIAAAHVAAKRGIFLASLPLHWKTECGDKDQCAKGSTVEIHAKVGSLSETSTITLANYGAVTELISCVAKEGSDEVTPWVGYCVHTFSWPKWSRPTCNVQATEMITSISAKRIEGKSERIDYSPLSKIPPDCPMAELENQSFALTPDAEQASK